MMRSLIGYELPQQLRRPDSLSPITMAGLCQSRCPPQRPLRSHRARTHASRARQSPRAHRRESPPPGGGSRGRAGQGPGEGPLETSGEDDLQDRRAAVGDGDELAARVEVQRQLAGLGLGVELDLALDLAARRVARREQRCALRAVDEDRVGAGGDVLDLDLEADPAGVGAVLGVALSRPGRRGSAGRPGRRRRSRRRRPSRSRRPIRRCRRRCRRRLR